MRRAFFKDLPAYQFHLLQKFSGLAGHGVFGRDGGKSKKPFNSLNVKFGIGDRDTDVMANRGIICSSLGLDIHNLVSAEQKHGKNIKIVDRKFILSYGDDEVSDTDAFITDIPEIALMIQVADCQAILILDPVKKVVAAVHAGWKGLAQNISRETIRLMKRVYGSDPAQLLVGISPSLGPCCAFFSEPEKELPEDFKKYISKDKRVDLWSYSADQLQKAGIKKNHIESAKICTQCNNGQTIEGGGRFFSFRGERGITGRFGVIIWLK
jgi:polyphenol oxidase